MDDDRDRPTDPPKRPARKLDAVSDADAPTVRRPEPRRARWLLRAMLLVVLVLGAVAGFSALYWKEIAIAIVLSQARAHGVSLELSTLEVEHHGLRIDRVTLGGAKLSMTSLPGLAVEADEIAVELDEARVPVRAVSKGVHAKLAGAEGVHVAVKKATTVIAAFTPTSTKLDGVTVDAPDAHALFDLSRAASAGEMGAISTEAQTLDIRLTRVSEPIGDALRITVQGLSRAKGTTTLTGLATKLPIVGLAVTLPAVELHDDGGALRVVVPSARELSIEVRDRGRKIAVELARVPADLLAKELGWSRPPDFALSARATLTLGEAKEKGVTGTYDAVLEHYVPPHPPELDGIVFGDATKVSGAFRLTGDRATLGEVRVVAGVLRLDGDGTAAIGGGGRVELTLSGSIACSELAASAIAAHLGLQAGFLAGRLAAGHLTGTVGVRLGVVVEGKDAAHPEVHPSASLHCGLAL